MSGDLMCYPGGECFAPALHLQDGVPQVLGMDPDDFQRRFHMYPPQVLNPDAEGETQQQICQNIGNLEKSNFLKSSSMKSRGVNCHPW